MRYCLVHHFQKILQHSTCFSQIEYFQQKKTHFPQNSASFHELPHVSAKLYKFQQEIFIDFFKNGLVSRRETYVNWDPVEKTVLANEQVIDGRGWRSNAIVERKKLSQWFFNITKFSEDLLTDLEKLEGWPDKVKLMQKNWIGKSLGCEIDFEISNKKG